MPQYKAPLRDMRFVMHELLGSQDTLSQLSGFDDVDRDLIDQILDEAARFAENVLFPINQSGDAEGCQYDNGEVRTPTGFKAAYEQFGQAGWIGLDAHTAYGGQGLPHLLGIAVDEMIGSANIAWSMYPGLTRGAYNALYAHADDESKALYLPKLLSGSWTGTMCLTEAHAGTDLGIIRSKAEPLDDGSFSITGQKIFISAGEHDLSENIIHLVLAKLPDAPEGTKGISLFIVPKYLVNADGTLGDRNRVTCGSIEHKMGIHGNATALLNFEGARAYLVGEPHQGMRYMFTMMNAARLGTGMQGLSLSEVSYQNALAYAKDRLQSRSLRGSQAPEQEADPIIVHADVRRMLLTQKAYTEGARALALWLALELDTEAHHPDPKARAAAGDIVALLTPIAKAFMTDNGFISCNLGMQVYGGHGYIREWGMEQYARDVRISQIYEGTNGIQALDLIGRKVLKDRGARLKVFGGRVQAFIKENQRNRALQDVIKPLGDVMKDVQDITQWVGMRALRNRDEVGAAATDYLRLVGHATYGYLWARMMKTAQDRLAQADSELERTFYQTKIDTGHFYFARLFPEVESLKRSIKAGSKTLMALESEAF